MNTHVADQDILTVLQGIEAPYLGTDIVSAGMVQGITWQDGTLRLAIDHRIPPRPWADELAARIRTAIRAAHPGVGEVVIQSSVSIDGLVSAQKEESLPLVSNTIAVASGKGGVGKSTVAVNLAIALARAGARVGLLDADIYGPSIPMMMGIREQPKAYSEGGRTVMLPCDNHGVRVMSIGFLIAEDDAMIWRGPMASSALRQLITDVDWGAIDYLIFDMPPGTGDIQLTLSQMLPLNGAVIVTTPQDVALADARKGVRMFERVNIPVLGLVENMSHHICSHCGHREDIFSTGGGSRAADNLGIPFLGDIPLMGAICEGGDTGRPIVVSQPDSPVAEAYTTLALTIAGSIAQRLAQGAATPAIDLSLPGSTN